MPTTEVLPVRFTVRFVANPIAVDAIMIRAAELDDENTGRHQTHYTLAQAMLVVLHGDPSFLFQEGRLIGWATPDSQTTRVGAK